MRKTYNYKEKKKCKLPTTPYYLTIFFYEQQSCIVSTFIIVITFHIIILQYTFLSVTSNTIYVKIFFFFIR